jgi:predicted Ser/Thr protein kinase
VGGRHLPGVDLESDEALEAFLERVPELLRHTIDHVSTKQVDAYVEQAKEISAEQIRRYLGVS